MDKYEKKLLKKHKRIFKKHDMTLYKGKNVIMAHGVGIDSPEKDLLDLLKAFMFLLK